MATKTLLKTRLQILSTDESGKSAKTFSLSRIALNADPTELLSMAKAIASLQTTTPQEYKLVDTSHLAE